MADLINQVPVRVLIVIVLYKMHPQDSTSLQTLNSAMKHVAFSKLFVKVFICDNTPTRKTLAEYPQESIYEASGENRGIANAYNRAIEIAHREGFDWLLTLDQDTQLPIDFLDKLADTAAYVAPMEQVAAIVPLIYDGSTLVSPNAGSYTCFPKKFPEEYTGISLEKFTSAFNSASTLRVSALKSIGGYDPRFWLDYSDAVMYHRLEMNGMKVFVSGNIRVQHELSVMDMQKRVSLHRYEGILSAESAYCDECMGKIAAVQLFIRLIYRSFFKFWGQRNGLAYSKIAFWFLCKRIVYSKKHRLKTWEHASNSNWAEDRN